MASASDVPKVYDLVIGDEGYVLADNWTGGESGNAIQKAIHSFSPAFVPRTNTQGNYGDDTQDFWLTFSQNDWSQGEDQKYQRRDSSTRRYWRGSSVDVTVPGEVTLRHAPESSVTASDDLYEVIGNPFSLTETWYGVGDTNLYSYDASGTETNEGTHGLASVAITPTAIAFDGVNLFFSTTTSPSVGVRKWNGSAFSTFSATGADALAFLNNALYGVRKSAGTFVRYSTAGTASTIHTWQDAAGAAITSQSIVKLCPLGGKLMIGRVGGGAKGSELWIYDGVAPAIAHQFDSSFVLHSMAVVNGVLFIGGITLTTKGNYPTVMYYANGQVGLLWREQTSTAATTIEVSPFSDGLVILANSTNAARVLFYSPATGGVHTMSDLGFSADRPANSVTAGLMVAKNGTTNLRFFISNTPATSGYVTSSLIDFDSSLNKIFRGLKVEYDEDGDGDGGSVDIAYRVGDNEGSFTTLQAGVTSGTEYSLSNITGRAIAYKATLNKGTSSDGPKLKRVYVRAVPLGNNYHRARYVLAAWGKDGTQNVELKNGTPDARTGLQIAMALMEAAESQTPLTITDKFETFTGIIESCELIEFRDREFVAQITVRQI